MVMLICIIIQNSAHRYDDDNNDDRDRGNKNAGVDASTKRPWHYHIKQNKCRHPNIIVVALTMS